MQHPTHAISPMSKSKSWNDKEVHILFEQR